MTGKLKVAPIPFPIGDLATLPIALIPLLTKPGLITEVDGTGG